MCGMVFSSNSIAIIGTGISGMAAAALLHPHHRITVYEKNTVIGGHSRTVDVQTPQGRVPVDTGFIVFNNRNYPLLTKLFDHLGVPVAKSDMSFGVSIADGWLEYGTRRPWNIFAQKRNLLRPQFWGLLMNLLRFNAQAKSFLARDPSITLGQCLAEMNMGDWFRDYYLLAMGGAIWSMPVAQMLEFPAHSFIRFFDNHGLLTITDHPQWHTVRGGSREYIQRLTAPFADHIRLNCGVVRVERRHDGVNIIDTQGHAAQYDQVIFACHADQALAMLANPTADEQRVLSAFRYQPNTMILHSDTRFMPRHKNAWASWVYLSQNRSDDTPAVSLSYWMNNLQPLATETPIIVTLNPDIRPDAALIYDEATFEHPVFDATAIAAQAEVPSIQGRDRLWFCGAYQRYGFHEDGLQSAVEMVRGMGIIPPWL